MTVPNPTGNPRRPVRKDDSDSVGSYHVSFTYVEPEYALQRGIPERQYPAGYTVLARNSAQAIEVATRLFWVAHRCSGVSWWKVITSTTCELLD